MTEKEFDYNSIEIQCADLKIVFITDEKTTVAARTDVHMHSFWELFYIQDGSVTVSTEQHRYELLPGDVLIIPPSAYHSSEMSDDAVKKSVLFTFEKVKSADSDKLFDEMRLTFSGCGFCKLSECGYIGSLIGAILEADSADKFAKKYRMQSSVSELMFYLYDRIKNSASPEFNCVLSQSNYWVYKYAIDRLLDIHYMNDISLTFLSEKLFVSPQNITKIVSAAYGKSFNELKVELKMRNAKKMLRETQLSVAEIGRRIGYTTQRGFFSAFLKYEGCTPSEYRKNCGI